MSKGDGKTIGVAKQRRGRKGEKKLSMMVDIFFGNNENFVKGCEFFFSFSWFTSPWEASSCSQPLSLFFFSSSIDFNSVLLDVTTIHMCMLQITTTIILFRNKNVTNFVPSGSRQMDINNCPQCYRVGKRLNKVVSIILLSSSVTVNSKNALPGLKHLAFTYSCSVFKSSKTVSPGLLNYILKSTFQTSRLCGMKIKKLIS